MPPKDDPYANVGTLITVAIKAPQCNPEKPKLWFSQLEAQFAINKIVEEKERYTYTCAFLPPTFANEVESLMETEPAANPYTTIKNRVIECFSKSKQANLMRLLDHEQMGERTPSQFLRHLKSLVPDIDEDVLKAKWLSRLPDQVQLGIANQTASIDELGKAADNLFEILRPRLNVASTSNLEQKIEQMANQIASLTAQLNSRSRSRSRSSSCSSRYNKKGKKHWKRKYKDICFFHKTFGDAARNCSPGCKYQGKGKEDQ